MHISATIKNPCDCFLLEKVESKLYSFDLFIYCFNLFRSSDDMKDEDSALKISSLSGANRKRKWKAEEEDDEEEQKAEDSSDVETSSSDSDDDEQEKMNESKETSSCQETKQEVKVEPETTEQNGEKEKQISEQEKVEKKKLSEPAVFIPVDRSAEVQVSFKSPCKLELRKVFLCMCFSPVFLCCCRRLV